MAGWPRNHSSHVTWLAWPWHMRTTSRKSQSLPLPLNTRKTFRMFRTKSFNLSLQDLQEGTQMTGNENDWGIGRSELSFFKKKNIWGSQLPISPIFPATSMEAMAMGTSWGSSLPLSSPSSSWKDLGQLVFSPAFYGWPKNGQTSFKYVLMGPWRNHRQS